MFCSDKSTVPPLLIVSHNNNVPWTNAVLVTLTFITSWILCLIYLVSGRLLMSSNGCLLLRCCSIEVVLLWYASSILQCTHTTMLSLIFNLKWSNTFDIFYLFLLLLSLCCVCSFSLFSVPASAMLYIKTVHTRYQKPASVFFRFAGDAYPVTCDISTLCHTKKNPCET